MDLTEFPHLERAPNIDATGVSLQPHPPGARVEEPGPQPRRGGPPQSGSFQPLLEQDATTPQGPPAVLPQASAAVPSIRDRDGKTGPHLTALSLPSKETTLSRKQSERKRD